MDREKIRSLIVGPIVTVPTPFDDDFEVDIGRMAEATQFWVESGLVAGKAVIKVAAAMGEGPMLREWEGPALLRSVVQAAKGRAAIVYGISHKDTLRTMEDAKKAQDLGAIGLQIAPPVFNDPTQADILRYFEAVSKAIGIGIVIYDQPWYPHGRVETDTFLKMRDFEHVVAIKWPTTEGRDYEDMRKLAPFFNMLDNSNQAVRCHQLGGRGYICDTAMAYPAYDLQIWSLMQSRRYDEAQALWEPVNHALVQFSAKLYETSGGQGRLNKGLMQIMGRPMGASRPPTLPLSQDDLAELRQLLIGFGWPVPTEDLW
jgi:4-hydroxy-tetrahydrodipicolinate synthase